MAKVKEQTVSQEEKYAAKVKETRELANLNQADLAQIAGVSPKTLAKIEGGQIPRQDAVIRIAKALPSLSVKEWLQLAGYSPTDAQIDAALSQGASVYPQLTPEAYFKRSIDRIKAHGNLALRCVCVMSPVSVASHGESDKRWKLVLDMMSAGLHIAMAVPFPFKAQNMQDQFPPLSQYYTSSYNWAYQSVRGFRQQLPSAADRVHVFTLKLPANGEGNLVYPPLRTAEIRPIITQYGTKNDVLFEFRAYFHFTDHRDDHWLDIHSTDQGVNERGAETFQMWHEYFRNILEAWNPEGEGETSKATYKFGPSSCWLQANI